MPGPPADDTISPMWMAHHYPEDYDRCVRIGRSHLCRRCLALYPAAFVALGLALAGLRWPHPLDPWLLVLLPLPGVIEFVAEHRGWIGYRPRLQQVLAVPMGVGPGGRASIATSTIPGTCSSGGWWWSTAASARPPHSSPVGEGADLHETQSTVEPGRRR